MRKIRLIYKQFAALNTVNCMKKIQRKKWYANVANSMDWRTTV